MWAHKNSLVWLDHGHKIAFGCLATGCWHAILWVLWVAGWGLCGSGLLWHILRMLNRSVIRGFWRPGIFAVRLGALSQCVARGGGVRVKVASTWLPGPEVSQQIICIATTWSVLFTSSVNGFNVVADWCMLWDKQSSLLWVISRSVFV